eukprot:6458705-Alexandrium_andersonii.AAC.1
MSASLVGSEMCIRDRAAPLEPSRPVGKGGPLLGGSVGPPRSRPARGAVCLLYTSDAADDM